MQRTRVPTRGIASNSSSGKGRRRTQGTDQRQREFTRSGSGTPSFCNHRRRRQ
jgi:hypothetical protein